MKFMNDRIVPISLLVKFCVEVQVRDVGLQEIKLNERS